MVRNSSCLYYIQSVAFSVYQFGRVYIQCLHFLKFLLLTVDFSSTRKSPTTFILHCKIYIDSEFDEKNHELSSLTIQNVRQNLYRASAFVAGAHSHVNYCHLIKFVRTFYVTADIANIKALYVFIRSDRCRMLEWQKRQSRKKHRPLIRPCG